MILNKTTKHLKIGVDKKGHRTKKWVNNDVAEKIKPNPISKTEDQPKKSEWWQEKLKHLELTRYPVGIPESDVKILCDLNNIEQCNSKCVAKYKDPKTGSTIMLYTKEFLNRNAEKKWERMKNVKSGTIDEIKSKSREGLADNLEKFRQASAICLIIANTGLRVGQTSGLEKTGNKGVSTLSPDDIKISKDGTISFEFIGKSYKNNTAEIKGEPLLAAFLKDLKNKKKGKERLFDIDRLFTDKVFKNRFGFKDLKIKDMRTYVATDLANKVLMSDINDVKESLTGTKNDVKVLNNKLKEVYKIVSDKLNNTPKMAETAYIHPAVRMEWLKLLGINSSVLAKSIQEFESTTLDSILNNSQYNDIVNKEINIDEEDEEECDEYNKFWFEDEYADNIEKSEFSDDLEKAKFKKLVPVHRKSGLNMEIRNVGSDKNVMKSKHFNLNKIGQHYDKHLTDLVDLVGDNQNTFHKVTNINAIKHGTSGGRGKGNADYTSQYKGLAAYNLHPDEIAYRNKLLMDQKDKLGLDDEKFIKYRNALVDKANKYIGMNSEFDVTVPEDKKSHDEFISITRDLNNRDNQSMKTNDEIHINNKTNKGLRVQKEIDDKRQAIQDERIRKSREESFDKEESKYKKFFDTISEFDISSMSVGDFYQKFVRENGLLRNMNSPLPHPLNKDSDVSITLLDGSTRTGKLGDLVYWAKEKFDNLASYKQKLPFSKINIVSYSENPYKTNSGFSNMS